MEFNKHTSFRKKVKKRVAILLKDADFFMMPVLWLKKKLIQDDPEIQINMKELVNIIESDEKFRLFESPNIYLTDNMKEFVSEDELGKMGFCKGPRAMLHERVPSKKELIEFLLNKADQTYETLKKAWDIRPDNDMLIEDQLLKALAKSQKLQRELNTVLSEENKKEEVEVEQV